MIPQTLSMNSAEKLIAEGPSGHSLRQFVPDFSQGHWPVNVIKVELEPRNPDAHYQLAIAYTRAGRKEDGEREFAIHQRILASGGGPGEQAPPPSQPRENK